MSIRDRMARGAAWMVSFKIIDRGFGFVSTLALARLLVPADFGIVAMATSLIALLELLTYFGLDMALLRQRETTEHHFNAVWTLNVLCGCAMAVLMIALSIPAAHFYREPRLTAVICILAGVPLIQSFENVGIVNFRKELRFDRDFRFMFHKRLVRFVFTLVLAVWLRNYWALVIGALIARAAGVALSFTMQSFRPRFSFRSLGDLMHFSKWLMLHNFVSFLRDRGADFVVGRLAGSGALGLFSVGTEIANMPGTELVAPINRAVVPAYMNIAHDLPALRREYLSVMSIVSLLAIPAVAGCAVCAPFFVLLFLGQKWAETASLIQILAFYGITRVMQSNAYAAFLAVGKPQYFVAITFSHVCVLVTLLIVLTMQDGLRGAAWAYAISSVVVMPVDFYFITRFMGVRPSAYVSALWRPTCGAVLMYLVVRILGPALPSNAALSTSQAAYSFLECIAIGAPSYVIAVMLFWMAAGRPAESAESAVLGRVRAFFHRVSVPGLG
jgi:lipopolysaccharide exporter